MLRMMQGHTSGVVSVSFSPDGKRIISSSWDNTARLWDAESGKQQLKVEHEAEVHAVQFSPEGKLFATGSFDN